MNSIRARGLSRPTGSKSYGLSSFAPAELTGSLLAQEHERCVDRTKPKADAPGSGKEVKGVAVLPEPPSPPAITANYWKRAV